MKIWLRRGTTTLVVAYLVALLAIAVVFRLVGEHWWVTNALMYAPRLLFLAPLPFVAIAAALWANQRIRLLVGAAAFIGFVPVMGFVATLPRSRAPDNATVRVLSFNIDSGYAGLETVIHEVLTYSPGIVVFQEVFKDQARLVEMLGATYPFVQTSTQFIVASRYPISAVQDPDRIPCYGKLRSPRFLKYRIETPLGPVALYNVHPVSPRWGFYALRGHGLRKEILSGRIFTTPNNETLLTDTALRELQVEEVSRLAASEADPVIIAGDTNLPSGGRILRENLSRYEDGFANAGFGFGYTFPAKHPWMRIDRIMAGPELRFTGFQVGCRGASDHLCVVADLARREP